MRKTLAFFVILIVLFVAFYLYTSSKQPRENIDVALKWKHQSQFAGMYVADYKGYYEKEGIDVNLEEFDFGMDPGEKLNSGESDFALMSAQEFVTHLSNGEDIVSVASIYQVSPYVIVSLPESGIVTPADFAGKKLGNKGGKVEERLFYLQLLKKYGLEESDVEIIDLTFDTKELEDLRGGRVDTVGLYRTDQLYFFEQENQLYNIILPERYTSSISNDLLVVKREYLENNKDIVEGLVSATMHGWDYAIENVDEAVDITIRYITDENYKDLEYERYILEKSISLIKTGTSQKIGKINKTNMQKLAQSMFDQGLIEKEVDISNSMTNEFIE